jgi:hypothetical protein
MKHLVRLHFKQKIREILLQSALLFVNSIVIDMPQHSARLRLLRRKAAEALCIPVGRSRQNVIHTPFSHMPVPKHLLGGRYKLLGRNDLLPIRIRVCQLLRVRSDQLNR